MKIGIDISQALYVGTGVGRYVTELTRTLIACDSADTYILFGSTLRGKEKLVAIAKNIAHNSPHVRIKILPFPPRLFDILWNILHIFPIEWFIGPVDVFWSSDWTQPPLGRARGITTIHDLTILRYPESFDQTIVEVHKRRLAWAVKECEAFLCDSQETHDDAVQLLGIDAKKLHVVYPGFSMNI